MGICRICLFNYGLISNPEASDIVTLSFLFQNQLNPAPEFVPAQSDLRTPSKFERFKWERAIMPCSMASNVT
jgi:hypothetical protein